MSANKVAERNEARGSRGVDSPVAVPSASPRMLMLVDALTGIVVARGVGDDSNVTAHAAPGIYILVAESDGTRTYTKLIIQ